MIPNIIEYFDFGAQIVERQNFANWTNPKHSKLVIFMWLNQVFRKLEGSLNEAKNLKWNKESLGFFYI